MRQIDEIHDAEHQRQTRRQQEQQQTELQSVQKLFDDQQHKPHHSAARKQRQRAGAAAALDGFFDHFIRHLSWKRSWSSLTMVATVFSESCPSASFTTSCK